MQTAVLSDPGEGPQGCLQHVAPERRPHTWNTHPSHLPPALPWCETKTHKQVPTPDRTVLGISCVYFPLPGTAASPGPLVKGVGRRSSPAPQEPVKTTHPPRGGRRPQGLCWGRSLCLEDRTEAQQGASQGL